MLKEWKESSEPTTQNRLTPSHKNVVYVYCRNQSLHYLLGQRYIYFLDFLRKRNRVDFMIEAISVLINVRSFLIIKYYQLLINVTIRTGKF